MNNTEFGQKVRKMREEQGLTREQFCGDEVELSVRQLTRIEAGASKPTLSKIQYIATRLGTSLYGLMPDYVDLPAEYTKLKYQVLRTPTYDEPQKAEERDAIVAKIYDDFYDILPEEEQLAVDALQCVIDVRATKSDDFGKDILTDYFHQIQLKDAYTVNDLLVLRLFIAHIMLIDLEKDDDKIEVLNVVTETLSKQIPFVESESLFVLRDTIFAVIVALGEKELYDAIPKMFNCLDEIMSITQDFQKAPSENLLRWKYELFVNHNRNSAEIYYNKAISFAEILGNPYLVDKIKDEWKQDINE